MSKTNEALPAGIHRAKTWEIAFYALNNTSTNLYMLVMMYVSYYATGIVGLGVVLVSTLAMAMRVFDGITDPIIGYVVDRTNGKFGKNRPFILIGNLILASSSLILYSCTHLVPESFRLFFYILIYVVYIIGYTFQCVVTKSAQTCMTNDPKQRPTFAIFDSIYNSIIMTGGMMLVPNVLEPIYRSTDASGKVVSGLANPALFVNLWVIFAIVSFICACLAIVGLWRKDRQEYFGLGTAQKVTFKDYWHVLKGNRAIQMLVVAASTDKLFMGIQGNTVVSVMLFGIVCGNYAASGMMGLITLVPTIIFVTIGMKLVASRMGQKKALLLGTYGCIASTILMFLLLVFGTPTDLLKGLNLFTLCFLVLRVTTSGFAGISGNIVIPMTADCADYETYRTGKYVPGLMGTLFSFVDKVISSLSSMIVGLMLAAIGFTTVQPDNTTPYSTSIFMVTLICFCGMPLIGWICNIIAMKFYPLDKEKMAEIQTHIAQIKANSKAIA